MSLAPAYLIAPSSRRRSLIAAALIAGAITIPWSRLFASRVESTAALHRQSIDDVARIVHFDDAGQLVREIVQHPHWQLQFGDAWFDCTARGFADVYTFGDGENITWDAPDMPSRTLALTDAERVALRGLPAMSAHEPYGDDEYDREERHFVVSFGDLKAGVVYDGSIYGPQIGARSPMGDVVSSIADAARWRYVGERMRFLGDVRLTLTGVVEPFDHITLALRGRAYEIRYRGRVIAHDALTEEQFVDLADWALAQPAGGNFGHDVDVRLSITVGDHTVRDGYAWSHPRVLEPLTRAIDDARYELSQAR